MNILTEKERENQINECHNKKRQLLDTYGIFGGGEQVKRMHQYINRKLEALGVFENHTISYAEWVE